MENPLIPPTEEELRELQLKMDRQILERTSALTEAIAILEQWHELYQKAVGSGDSAEALQRIQGYVKGAEDQVQLFRDGIALAQKRKEDHYKFLRRCGIEL